MKQATFVRRIILANPNATLEEVQSAWDKAGHPRSGRPKDQSPIYMARTIIKKRYGLKSLDDIPRKKSGKVNITGLLRLVRRRKPGITEKECRSLLAVDGIEFSPALWSVMIHADKKKNGTAKKPKAVRSIKARRAPKVFEISPRRNGGDLLELESRLDELIERARSVNESETVRFLKDARRHVAQSILNAAR